MANLMFINQIPRNIPCSGQYFVDTNVWVYYAYMANKSYNLSKENQYKINEYSRFIEKVKESGGSLFTSSLCLSELANVIERKALEQYNHNNNTSLKIKKFREISQERQQIVDDIDTAWCSIKDIATIIEHSISKETGEHIITEIRAAPLDAYDAIFLQLIKNKKLTNIITDDKDFQEVSDHIDIYTA
ncbi:TPA: type II toxin-antitoxin system VapC family toxin [Pasteurella multocida]|uniref:type II toxin-antitoxin system VapC family toxin n=1 Tax=Pasteurella multocida TaxID=747 RepID=UPI0009F2D07F|nr:PIN domain-containing protein [Pasteurella multocida]MEB3489464.1 PIN domain-containing protein [Pasteurella multocida]PNM03616.1 PIN domain-containing protein [Pasteurella multocida]HDR1039433.1 type II toxin-antitoxin system VapC family toxin [Pasteurella multocida]HDR1114063.1 type II toxin-antitoxin system VapC family toxin [Pasteurella multocida]HDR1120592.1 type II toxin-antitoxin system VapC family toxin [Pasteurella multocida]